jgi:hypothetical protein
MEKPTLQEVKEYFKNAEKVRGLDLTMATFSKADFRGIHHWGGDYWICAEYGNCLIYESDTNRYAKILSHKQEPKTDPIVESVVKQFQERSEVGIKKYGTTLAENNTDDFLQHLKEELMDAVLYLQKLQDGTK